MRKLIGTHTSLEKMGKSCYWKYENMNIQIWINKKWLNDIDKIYDYILV